ncbi:NAD(P)/FAD-dependent oxidoreductase [Salinisphaera aquimarina]|uniref:NAD(P)/FAD-dependent oxidoreductase n=1 Tax=Salinisphaera aquimarina TaxID=2094031 RepID=A0ABV7EPL1_9GAMM
MESPVQKYSDETTATASSQPYDSRYDPLKSHAHPGQGQEYAPTYWVDTVGPPPADDGPVTADLDADVVIIGSGFTGLACAMYLAEEHGIKATVLEANRSIWGCTSRNGGQGQNASGRLKRSQWIEKWGKETALKLDAELRISFDSFRTLTREIDCDAQPGGHLHIAHRPKKMEALRVEAKVMREVFGYDATILSAEELHRDYVDDSEGFGALHEPDGIGVHPLKLAHGYMRRARAKGARVHPASPVVGIETRNGVHHVRTPGGTVRARAVGMATGGYTSNGLHPSLDSKIMPVLSNSLVTRPLTPQELDATNFLTKEVVTDSRTLRFYYRLLPDNRVQMGSRASITGKDAPNPKHLQVLIDGLHRKFPPLKGIQIDYSWWGWVDVSHDAMPRVFQPDPKESIFYAVGYGGNGVSFSQHAGRRMAERIAGRQLPVFELPIYNSPLEYPNIFNAIRSRAFAPFRRIGQRSLYHWYYLRDEKF